MTTRITVKNEVGTKANPYEKYIDGGYFNVDWRDWNTKENLAELPAPGIPDTKEGESVEAELVWQAKKPNSNIYNNWFDITEDDRDFYSEFGYSFQKIYRLVQQPKEQEKEKTAEGILDQLGGSYFNGIAKSTIIEAMEAYATQQTAIKDTRISELEARVKELERALDDILGYCKGDNPIRNEIKNIATNALKTDKK